MNIQRVGDIDIYYETHGQGEPVLFVHGLGSSSRDWEYQIPVFAKHYQVITLDIRGHGKTTKSKGRYSIEAFASDITKFMKIINIKNYHIVGLSMGGMIAFQIAIDSPETLISMTIVNSGPDFTASNFKFRLKIAMRFIILRTFGLKGIANTIADGLFPKKKHKHLHATFIRRLCRNDKKSYLKSLKAIVRWSVINQIAKISNPTLIVCADRDYSSVASKQSYADKMPNANLAVIKDSHHALPVEKPEEFNEAVLNFIKEQTYQERD